ncbi:hypothetical protein BMF77_04509 [Dolichospermum sp. UHCC 0315A]|jgi:hypothetical protein|nr:MULTISPECIES: hypothetical protein [Dolichospermum]MDB9436767.1 hypothetical protein [Dolichospermum lemmermannii CS-548]QEI43885.1 hypothetical protein BMF77_04509 [Dolichospermum sp. UHCC 0315A]
MTDEQRELLLKAQQSLEAAKLLTYMSVLNLKKYHKLIPIFILLIL